MITKKVIIGLLLISMWLTTVGATNSPKLYSVESIFEKIITLSTTRLERLLIIVGEESVSRSFTEAEFKLYVLNPIKATSKGVIKNLDAVFLLNRIEVSSLVNLGPTLAFLKVTATMKIKEGNLTTQIISVQLNENFLPDSVIKGLEKRINSSIQANHASLKITEFELKTNSIFLEAHRNPLKLKEL